MEKRPGAQEGISLYRMLRPGDDVVLHLRGHIHEVGGEAGDPDHQVMVIRRVLLGLPQGLRVHHVVLDLHAAPDGRKTGEPIADACSPAQGRDTCGPTGVFNSAVKFEHGHYLDGMALNLKIHPTSLRANDGVTKLEDMTRTYFDRGGMEIQYNVVDAETLRKAQKTPADYHNLVVRIAGFSAYFVVISTK